MKRYLTFIISIILFNSYCYAQLIPVDKYSNIIELAMTNFWGKAQLKDGTTVQPDSEAERTTLPITNNDAHKVIQAGEISSIAAWCGLDWQKNYLRVTKSARSSGLSGKQVAFVGLLHGVTMGIVESALNGKKCTQNIKDSTAKKLKRISNKSLKFDRRPDGPPAT